MIDWRLANTVASAVVSAAPAPPDSGEAYADEVRDFAERSAELVSSYTGLHAFDALPAPESIDRSGWAKANLVSMQKVLDPVVGRVGDGMGPLSGVARVAAGTLLAVEVGALSGYLAARVLGQYEFPILDPAAPARLLFVTPNLAQAATRLNTDSETLVRWVALHETTHALQFTGVPWLRRHMADRVRTLLSAMDVKIDPRRLLRMPTADDIKGVVASVRRGELAHLVAGPERRGILDELQATMALLEGYAEHVMDAVGEPLLPDLDRLRSGMDRRRRERSGFLRILEKLIGLELKMRQYEQGKAFCDAVVAEGGIAALNRAWERPEHIPTLAELDAPDTWISRVSA